MAENSLELNERNAAQVCREARLPTPSVSKAAARAAKLDREAAAFDADLRMYGAEPPMEESPLPGHRGLSTLPDGLAASVVFGAVLVKLAMLAPILTYHREQRELLAFLLQPHPHQWRPQLRVLMLQQQLGQLNVLRRVAAGSRDRQLAGSARLWGVVTGRNRIGRRTANVRRSLRGSPCNPTRTDQNPMPHHFRVRSIIPGAIWRSIVTGERFLDFRTRRPRRHIIF